MCDSIVFQLEISGNKSSTPSGNESVPPAPGRTPLRDERETTHGRNGARSGAYIFDDVPGARTPASRPASTADAARVAPQSVLGKCDAAHRIDHRPDRLRWTPAARADPPVPPLPQVKDRVYKQRIRIQDFFGDFDRLRCGSITPTQFARALALAGFNLTQAQYRELSDAYPSTVEDRPVCYKDFCADVNGVFTKYNLEKAPTQEVDPAPASLLDTERFSAKPTRSLGDARDEEVDALKQAKAVLRGANFSFLARAG